MNWKSLVFIIFLIVLSDADEFKKYKRGTGPVFILEPPTKVNFLNTKGAIVDCLFHGEPEPQTTWFNEKGKLPSNNDLYRILPNNSLMMRKFGSEHYDQNVHSTIYTCRAQNKYGIIVSNNVHITSVDQQKYSTQVYDEYVIEGNAAVLRCHIPSYVKDYVKVTAWIKDEFVRILPDQELNGKYSFGNDGQLLISNANDDDSKFLYKCETTHTISKSKTISQNGGTLHITKPSNSISPNIILYESELKYFIGDEVKILCVAQSYPKPNYSWCFKKRPIGECKNVDHTKFSSLGYLLKFTASTGDSGIYTCHVHNEVGKVEASTVLTIYSPISVFIHPQSQMVNIHQSINIECVVTGGPISFLFWMNDGKRIFENGRQIESKVLNLTINSASDSGMYQCFAGNEFESQQSSAQVFLSAMPPTLRIGFDHQILNPGDRLLLSCSFNGDPLPKLKWTLRGDKIIGNHRIKIEKKEELDQVSTSILINDVKTLDGGVYTCHAENSAGNSSFFNKIDVYGAPYVWPIKNQTAPTGSTISLECSTSGYPISSITWNKDGYRLMTSPRIKIDSNGTLTILSVTNSFDNGAYRCIAKYKSDSASSYGYLNVIQKPSLKKKFEEEIILSNKRLNLFCSVVDGDPPINFDWYFNEDKLPHNLLAVVSDTTYTSTLKVVKTKQKHSGNYTCRATNSVGYTEQHFYVHVKAPPTWKFKPSSRSVQLYSTIYLHCSGTGYPNPISNWIKIEGDSIINIGTEILNNKIYISKNGSLIIKSIQEKQLSEIYRCKVSNGIGPDLYSDVKLTKQEDNIVFVPHANSLETLAPKMVKLVCEANHRNILIAKWQTKSNNIKEINIKYEIMNENRLKGVKSVLVIRNTESSDTGIYTCQVSSRTKSNSTSFYLKVIDNEFNDDKSRPFDDLVNGNETSNGGNGDKSFELFGPTLLYIIPTITAAIVLFIILIIVCVLLTGQRRKNFKNSNRDSSQTYSGTRRKSNFDIEYENSTLSRYSERYYGGNSNESDNFYAHISTYPRNGHIQPYATFTSDKRKNSDTIIDRP